MRIVDGNKIFKNWKISKFKLKVILYWVVLLFVILVDLLLIIDRYY